MPLLTLCFCLFCFPLRAEISVLENLALYGQPKYTSDFKNFDYVNPNAPKGGKVTFPAYGTFDSFNPFIFKGIAASDSVALTLDTLGVVPVDDYSTVYPLSMFLRIIAGQMILLAML